MSNFYTGQRVVCVNAYGNNSLSQGATYTVTGFLACCQEWLFVAGTNPSPYDTSHCPGCGASSPCDKGTGYRPSRFRPIDSLTEQIERIEEEGAPVEPEPEHA